MANFLMVYKHPGCKYAYSCTHAVEATDAVTCESHFSDWHCSKKGITFLLFFFVTKANLFISCHIYSVKNLWLRGYNTEAGQTLQTAWCLAVSWPHPHCLGLGGARWLCYSISMVHSNLKEMPSPETVTEVTVRTVLTMPTSSWGMISIW